MDRDEFYREARDDLPGPLAGLRVLEVSTTWAAPMCGCMLADFGADVVKVEQPGGEIARRSPPFLPGTDPPVSFMHATVNRNKRSLALDLRDAECRDIFLGLAARSDVVLENFRPGVLESWGLGYAQVRGVRPDVVYVSISGYGQWGAGRERAGYDPLAQAESGFLSLNGSPDGPPVKSPTFLGDDLAGLHAAFATLAALRHRDRHGEGQHVDLALLDAMKFQSTGYLTLGAMGVELPRLGNDFRIAAPARVFPCSDGSVMAGVLLDSHWKRLSQVMERPELADDERYASAAARIARREEVSAILGDWLAERPVAEAVARLREAGLPVAPVRSYAEAAADPGTRERGMLTDVRQSDGSRAPLVGPAAQLSRTPVSVRHGAAALGAHSDELLDELGIDAEARRRMRERGVL